MADGNNGHDPLPRQPSSSVKHTSQYAQMFQGASEAPWTECDVLPQIQIIAATKLLSASTHNIFDIVRATQGQRRQNINDTATLALS